MTGIEWLLKWLLNPDGSRVWTEEEIREVKQVAKLLLHAGFKKVQTAHLLDVSASSIYNWIKKGEI